MSGLVKKPRNILIVGAGCLGMFLASNLALEGKVSCFDVDGCLVKRLRKRGMIITNNMADYEGHVFDLVIIATKCAAMKIAVKSVVDFCQAKTIAFLQNGSFSLDWVRDFFPDAMILRGVITAAISRDELGDIRVCSSGALYLGQYAGDLRNLRFWSGVFKKCALRTLVVSDYRSAVWAKLIFSAIMNPLPIMVGTDYSVVRKDKRVYTLISEAIKEGKQVAVAADIRLAFDPMFIVNRLKQGNLGRFQYYGSMYYDYENGNVLETEYITGEVIRQARVLGIKTPVLDTVYALIKVIEKGRDEKR